MAWVEFPAFSSSNIASVKYDGTQRKLRVTFMNGGTYEYYDIPQQVAEEFMRAESKGAFLAANIKGSYRYSKV